MTNEEMIMTKIGANDKTYHITLQLMNLARQDEREKMQGVDCWISWDYGSFEYPLMTIKRPIQNTFTNGEIYHTGIGQNFSLKKEDAEKLGIQKGQCKKFRIVCVCDE